MYFKKYRISIIHYQLTTTRDQAVQVKQRSKHNNLCGLNIEFQNSRRKWIKLVQ